MHDKRLRFITDHATGEQRVEMEAVTIPHQTHEEFLDACERRAQQKDLTAMELRQEFGVDVVGDDDSLTKQKPYIEWRPGASVITLDGSFTPYQMQRIVDWMAHTTYDG